MLKNAKGTAKLTNKLSMLGKLGVASENETAGPAEYHLGCIESRRFRYPFGQSDCLEGRAEYGKPCPISSCPQLALAIESYEWSIDDSFFESSSLLDLD